MAAWQQWGWRADAADAAWIRDTNLQRSLPCTFGFRHTIYHPYTRLNAPEYFTKFLETSKDPLENARLVTFSATDIQSNDAEFNEALSVTGFISGQGLNDKDSKNQMFGNLSINRRARKTPLYPWFKRHWLHQLFSLTVLRQPCAEFGRKKSDPFCVHPSLIGGFSRESIILPKHSPSQFKFCMTNSLISAEAEIWLG
jgi:hypothetical protein